MKIVIYIIINCTLFIKAANAQQSTTPQSGIDKDQYQIDLKKYHTNKSTAWVFAGTGIVMFGIGIAKPTSKYYIDNNPALGYPKRKGGALLIAGGIIGAASIPFFINAAKYKRKASIILKGESAILFDPAKYFFQYPVLSLKIQI